MKTTLLALILFFSITVKGQIVIKSDDPGIKYNLIQPGHITSNFIGLDSSGNKIQEFVMDNFITVNKTTGEIALIRSSLYEATHTYYIDTSFISPLPVRMHSTERPAHKELQVQFEPTTVKVKSIIGGVGKDEVYPIDEGYFDDNILVDIMGVFPIEQGKKYAMKAFRYESVKTKGISTYEVEYLHDDYLTGPENKLILCKVLYYKNDYCYGYAWYDKLTRKPAKLIVHIKSISYLVNFGS